MLASMNTQSISFIRRHWCRANVRPMHQLQLVIRAFISRMDSNTTGHTRGQINVAWENHLGLHDVQPRKKALIRTAILPNAEPVITTTSYILVGGLVGPHMRSFCVARVATEWHFYKSDMTGCDIKPVVSLQAPIVSVTNSITVFPISLITSRAQYAW